MTGKKCIINFSEKEERIQETTEQLIRLLNYVKISWMNAETHAGKQTVIKSYVVLQWRWNT